MTESETVAALIDAAEHAFATTGIEQASLRAVMRAAGADPGAIHYHFGGRERLAAAVLARVLAPLNARRVELLAAAEALAADRTAVAGAPVPVPLRLVVDALIRPDVEAAAALDDRGAGRARLLGAIHVDPSRFVTAQVEAHFAPVAERFHPHLVAAAPDVEPAELAWRVRWFVFGPVGALLRSDGLHVEAGAVDDLVDRLLAPAVAALGAN